MSTQIQLHVRTDDVKEGHLAEVGVLGPMAQMTMTTPGISETMDVMSDLPSVIVGKSTRDFPPEVRRTFDEPREVTDSVIQQMKAAAKSADTDASNVIEWLEDHRGEDVFAVGY